jgi:hypothetical protein
MSLLNEISMVDSEPFILLDNRLLTPSQGCSESISQTVRTSHGLNSMSKILRARKAKIICDDILEADAMGGLIIRSGSLLLE